MGETSLNMRWNMLQVRACGNVRDNRNPRPDFAFLQKEALFNRLLGINGLASDGTNLFAGGDFTNAGGSHANRVAQWNGTSWFALGAGADKTVNALAWVNGVLFMGGSFTNAGGAGIVALARWDGAHWTALGLGLGPASSASVSGLAVSGADLIVGGSFAQAGGRTAGSYGVWHTVLPPPQVFIQSGVQG